MKKHLLFAILFCTQFSVASAQLFEDFEEGTKNSYAAAVVELASGPWMLDDALLGTLAGDKKNGLKSVRIRNGFMAMEFDYPGGLSEVSFYAANYGDNSGGVLEVSYSTDGGNAWTALGNPLTLGTALTQYTLQGSVQGNVRLRFEKTAGDRINVDDVLISDYIEVSQYPALLFRINQLPYNSGNIGRDKNHPVALSGLGLLSGESPLLPLLRFDDVLRQHRRKLTDRPSSRLDTDLYRHRKGRR